MLDRDLLRNDPERVRKAAALKNEPCPIDEWLRADSSRRTMLQELEDLRRRKNEISQRVSALKKAGQDASAEMEESKKVGESIPAMEKALAGVESCMASLELRFPNLPDPDVPEGRDATANVVVRERGEKPVLPDTPRQHWDILKGFYDPETAGKIAGSNFILFRGPIARLQRTLISWMLERHAESGMEEIWAPFLARPESMTATGQLPKLGADMYRLEQDDLYLIPTGEVPITNIYRDSLIEEERLPIRMCGYTPCFRREAGSYGRETRGLNRVHQFEKVEMVRIEHPDRSEAALEEMVGSAEALLSELNLPYRVVKLSTGDLSFAAAKCYDLEIWSAGQEKWLEVSSVSNFREFQARRGGIRFRPSGGGKPRFAHTLNGSGLALPRLIIALAEAAQPSPDPAATAAWAEGLVARLSGRPQRS
jgi:seryl-tRNA synthetase